MWIILLIWLAYTILYTLHPSDALAALLELVPGVLAVTLLVVAGLPLQECYLRPAPISRTGLVLLAVSLLFMPCIWLTGRWTGWNGMAALVYAPASGIAQELFFRAALLPVLLVTFKQKPLLALLLHSLLFALWHVPNAYRTAPLWGVIGVVGVTFVCGLLWGKQVQRDRTVIWLMGYHSLLLIANSFFTWV
jgi:membrane protease YdiL (CAAX protease family)